jgi:hypothetical protein
MSAILSAIHPKIPNAMRVSRLMEGAVFSFTRDSCFSIMTISKSEGVRYVVAIHLDSKDYAFGEMEQLSDVQEQNLEKERNDYLLSMDGIEQEVTEPMCMIMFGLIAGSAGLFF